MGPQHPSTHGVLRVILKLDGEKVMGTECIIGYLHRGVEKIAENRTYQMFNPYVDRMDYVAAVSNGLGYCLGNRRARHHRESDYSNRLHAQSERVVFLTMGSVLSREFHD